MCKEIIIKLIIETTSLWTMTGVPVAVCTYDVAGVQHVERQFGFCSKQPKKLPDTVLKIAIHNACAK